MKKYKMLGVLAISAVMFTGCIDSMPELSSDESDMVAEYAAGLLLKYSPNYNYMLVSEDELAAALNQRALEEQALVEETETTGETEEAPGETASKEETPETDLSEGEAEEPSEEAPAQMLVDMGADLVTELGLTEDVLLRYQSFEICDAYPQNASGFSGIDAKEGEKLLVMHFDLENDTDETIDCHFFDYELQLRVTINDTITKRAEEMPILPDDMMSFMGTLSPGEKTDVVAIAQIEELSDSDIMSMMLQITSSNGSCSIKIR